MKPMYLNSSILLFGLFGSLNCASYSQMDALYKTITSGKNVNIRPVLNQSHPAKIFVFFDLVYIQEFDEVNGKLNLAGIFAIQWQDETVKWNATNNGMHSLTYTSDDFWKPSLLIGNSYGRTTSIFKDDTAKRAISDGRMFWMPIDNYEVTCIADVSKYPFDTHQCSMMFVMLGYYDTELIVNHSFDRVITYWYSPRATWDLVKTSVSKDSYP